jgi:hypothetical protein
VFLTDRRARVALAAADLDPDSGRGRLSYRRAEEIFTDRTKPGGACPVGGSAGDRFASRSILDRSGTHVVGRLPERLADGSCIRPRCESFHAQAIHLRGDHHHTATHAANLSSNGPW